MHVRFGRTMFVAGAVALVSLVACGDGGESGGRRSQAPGSPGAGGDGPPAPYVESMSDSAGFVVVGDTRLYFTAFGAGEPLLVVHGGPGLDQRYMRPWLDGLQDVARVVYYDQRGTGGSTGPFTAEALHFDQFVEDLDRIRIAMGWERFTVLGHSWGGILAVDYARLHPERLDGLVLMSTAEPGTRFAAQAAQRSQEARTAEDQSRIREIMASEAFAEGAAEAVSEIFRIVFRSTLADPSDIKKLDLALSEATARNRNEVTRLLQQGMVQPEWWPDLGNISVPTLILHGRHDPSPMEMAAAMADSLPNARLVRLRDSGHFPFAEEPDVVMEEIRRFLGEGRSPTRGS
ncbi:MAG: alpha/beta fold hydrolase, partial [Gemmatimonadota bacterium]|nr:alpha/beta fold hydrolase [Gemmatimonadota bacterium]